MSSERAFTLVELLVVMIIAAILATLGVYAIHSARSGGQRAAAITSAQAYADSVDEFARDHRGQYPAIPGNWSSALERGPRDASLGTHDRYLREVPEAVQSGSVKFASAPDPTRPTLVYAAENGGLGFRIEVHVPGSPPCALRGGAPDTAPVFKPCSSR
jgi:prepilin-type N-terminal cleavage/methylation domain-containing protein